MKLTQEYILNKLKLSKYHFKFFETSKGWKKIHPINKQKFNDYRCSGIKDGKKQSVFIANDWLFITTLNSQINKVWPKYAKASGYWETGVQGSRKGPFYVGNELQYLLDHLNEYYEKTN